MTAEKVNRVAVHLKGAMKGISGVNVEILDRIFIITLRQKAENSTQLSWLCKSSESEICFSLYLKTEAKGCFCFYQ